MGAQDVAIDGEVLESAPKLLLSGEWESQNAGGGWAWVLSDLKSLLETGHSMFR